MLGFIKDGIVPSSAEWCVLIIGIIVAFAVSLAVIRFLGFVKKHSFESFGWYRIVLGIVVIIYFAINGRVSKFTKYYLFPTSRVIQF